MDIAALIERLALGEDSRHQFKTNIHNADQLAGEMVAFSNSEGGYIFIGVADDGTVSGLSGSNVARINGLISNAASNNVRPAITPTTENIPHPDGTVLVVSISKGLNTPYMDTKGVVWVKSGADKRRTTAREELQRMFQKSGLIHADATPVPTLGIGDLDMSYFEKAFTKVYDEPLDESSQSLEQVLTNMNVMQQGRLNVAGGLLFAREPQYALPTFIVKAVAFEGTDIEDTNYLDSRDIKGKLADIFQQTNSFIRANTRAVQGAQGFNSQGQSEIPRIVWEELITNALIHRDYFISAPVRVMVFADRVEIISPGHLPNSLTVENMKVGNSNIRNPILASFASKLLPYRGLGSGVRRALKEWPHIEFIDDRGSNLFKVIVARPTEATP